MIRELTTQDLPQLVELGEHFYREGKLPGGFKKEVFIKTWTTFLQMKLAILLGAFECKVSDGSPGGPHASVIIGSLGAVICPDPNDGDLVAQEMFWFVMPGSRGRGIRLLREYERVAKERGAKRATMVHLQAINENLGPIYERFGYGKIETQYMKEL